MSKQYVYAFDCVGCFDFYGENSLTADGRLFCPNCEEEQRLDSPYTEKIAVLYTPDLFVPTQTH